MTCPKSTYKKHYRNNFILQQLFSSVSSNLIFIYMQQGRQNAIFILGLFDIYNLKRKFGIILDSQLDIELAEVGIEPGTNVLDRILNYTYYTPRRALIYIKNKNIEK